MLDDWTLIDGKVIGDYRIFQLREVVSQSPQTGQNHHFFVLDAPDWVNIVPVTSEGQLVLIRQYRHGTESMMLEIPGGMVDREDDSSAAAARRELREETGYDADEWIHLGSMTPNPAFLNNQLHTYLALNAHKIGLPQLDGSEEIEIELVDLASIPELVLSGQINHALVIAAFYFFEHHKDRG